MENKVLMIQNAEHVEAMRKYAIERLHSEAANCTEPGTISVVVKKARDMGLYEVASDIQKEFDNEMKKYERSVWDQFYHPL